MKTMNEVYVSPSVEVVEVEVEHGFALSGDGNVEVPGAGDGGDE